MRYVPASSRLRAVLMSWAVFGMSGPFLCPSAFKMAADWAGDQSKAPLFCYVAVIRKKGPFPGPSPKDPRVQCSTRPWITMHHRPRSRGLLGSKHCELYSNILSHFHVHVCEQAVNISSHCIIHLMQYLIHVHGITNVCLFLLHTIKFIVICKKNKQVI